MATTITRSQTNDFFQWSNLKDLVHRDEGTPQTDLITPLHTACTSVDPLLLRRGYSSFPLQANHREHFGTTQKPLIWYIG
ncbi:hypothetical protein TNCV_1833081 [Trichonephila clavipes]|nr:hypothetical protein TNCV_1833081 [Trichonephila clavipes]